MDAYYTLLLFDASKEKHNYFQEMSQIFLETD